MTISPASLICSGLRSPTCAPDEEDEEVDAPPEHAAMPRAATMATAAVASRRNGFLRA